MNNRIALVTGATGAVGPTLVSHLINNGYAVRTFSRTLPTPGLLHPSAVHFSGLINDAAALDLALEGVRHRFPPCRKASHRESRSIPGTPISPH